MSLDRRIYAITALAALVGGSAVVFASPQDPFDLPQALASEAGTPLVWHDATAPERVAPEQVATDEPPAPPAGLVLTDSGDRGVGVRAPAVWPVDVRREMAAEPRLANVGIVR